MQNKDRIRNVPDKLKRTWVMLSVFGSIATVLTVYHSLLHPDPLYIFYVIIISLLFTLTTIFIIFETSKSKYNLKHLSKTSVFLCIYIILIIWLGINKTIPEHQEILEFQQKRADLTYWIYKKDFDTYKQLALLYMNASPAIKRIEPSANHFGTKLMKVYLENKIAAGEGSLYSQDMYDLAEAIFVYSSRDLAHVWYQSAYEYGKANALKRYEERMVYFR